MGMIIHFWSIVMMFLGVGQAQSSTRCKLTYKIQDGYDDYVTMVYADAKIEFRCDCTCSTSKGKQIRFRFSKAAAEPFEAAENKIRKLISPVGDIPILLCETERSDNCYPSNWVERPPVLCSDCQNCTAGQICMENAKNSTCQSISNIDDEWPRNTCGFKTGVFEQDSVFCIVNNKDNKEGKPVYDKPTFCEAVLWQQQDSEQRQIMAQISTQKDKVWPEGLCRKEEFKKLIKDRLQLRTFDETGQKYVNLTWGLGARYILTKSIQIGILRFNTTDSEQQCFDIDNFECSYKTKGDMAAKKAFSQQREGFCKHFNLLENLNMGTETKVTCNVTFKIENKKEIFTLFFYGIKPGQPEMRNLTCDNKYCKWDNPSILKSEYQLIHKNTTAICTAEITDDFCFPKPSRPFNLFVSVPAPNCDEEPTPAPQTTNKTPLIAGVVIAVLVILIIAMIAGFVLYKRNRDKRAQVDITPKKQFNRMLKTSSTEPKQESIAL